MIASFNDYSGTMFDKKKKSMQKSKFVEPGLAFESGGGHNRFNWDNS